MRLSILLAAASLSALSAAAAAELPLRDLTPEQEPAAEAGAPNPGSLKATISADHTDNTYAIGESVHLRVTVNEDAYVTVLDIGPSGHVIQLFPTASQPDNHLAANRPVDILGGATGPRIKVTPPTGTELIKVISSSKPIKLVPESQLQGKGALRAVAGGSKTLLKDLDLVRDIPPDTEVAFDNFAVYTATTHSATAPPPVAAATPTPAPVIAAIPSPAPSPAVAPVSTPAPVIAAIPSPAPSPAVAPVSTPAPVIAAIPSPAPSPAVAPVPAPAPVIAAVPPAPPSVQVPATQPFSLILAADKSVYRPGEKLLITATPGQACNLAVFEFTTAGQVRPIYPNPTSPSAAAASDEAVYISGGPPMNQKVSVAGPAGSEQLVAICVAGDAPAPSPDLSDAAAAARALTVAAAQAGTATAVVDFKVQP
jgi:hypothetical protein